MNSFIGEIIILPLNFAPPGYLPCDGQLLPIAQYTALFSLIGTTFGGNGSTTFALPNYQGLAPKGSNYFIAVEAQMPTQTAEPSPANQTAGAPQMPPPWYALWSKINGTVGNDPGVTVNPLDTSQNPYIVPITVADNDQAVALASIMILNYNLGEVQVNVQIKNGAGVVVTPVTPTSPDQLAGLVQTALAHNGWFVTIVKHPITMGGPDVIFPVFAKQVLQYPGDDWSDAYQNYNNVVAFTFRNVLQGAPGKQLLAPSTALS